MRHLGSFLLAVALTPIVYVLTGVGLSAFGQAAQRGVEQRPMASVLSIATLAVAGVVYAVLVMARLSPVGPALAGFVFLATSAWPLVDPASYTNAIDSIDARFKILGVDILGIDLVGKSGIGVLLAIPLIATLTSPRRWSRYADRTAAEVAYYQQPTGYQQTYAGAQTRPLDPVTEQLPDVSPPTLFYPRSSSAAAPAPMPVRPTEAAADTVLLPPPAAAAAAPASAAPAPAAAPTPAPEVPKAQAPKPPTIPAAATSLIAEPPKAEQAAPRAPEPDSDKTVRIDPDTLKPI